MLDKIKDYFLPHKLVLVPYTISTSSQKDCISMGINKKGKTLRFLSEQNLEKKICSLENITFGIQVIEKGSWDIRQLSCFKKGKTIGNKTYGLFERYGLNDAVKEDKEYSQYFSKIK